VSTAEYREPAEAPLVIRPAGRWVRLGLGELWDYRGLLYFLTWRDLKIRYKQTVGGLAWAILQPFFLMVVFNVLLHKVGKVPSEGVPYPIFSYTALIAWTFFSSSLSFASNSVVASGALISKVYFPRLIVAISPALSYLVDLALAFTVLIGMMFYYGIYPDPLHVWLVLPLTLLALVTAIGVGMWLSALNVRYRDVRFLVPFLIQIWFFLTPVIYPASLIHGAWRTIYALNPMAGVVDGFRWALIGVGPLHPGTLLISAGVSVVVLVGGAFHFRRLERTFADVV
jgi:lipopolysaccharide transport system permease protein